MKQMMKFNMFSPGPLNFEIYFLSFHWKHFWSYFRQLSVYLYPLENAPY